MILALKRRRAPEDPNSALIYFSLIAATGFAAGWLTQALAGF